jgi:DNA-binding NarL/FixJ family response regulator
MNLKPASTKRSRAVREIVVYGLSCGLLLSIVTMTEYRFLVVYRSIETFGAFVALLFAGLGIWVGFTLSQKKPMRNENGNSLPAVGAFVPDERKIGQLEITPRELEILGLIAAGLSNREIANRLFISENTVKTHSSRLFDKLGARRRTQAVQLGKELGLIP